MLFNGRKVVLASASPRRLAILRQVGIEPEVCAVDIEEIKELSGNMDEEALTVRNATMKAQAASEKYDDALVIAADTIVVLEGQIFGKPADEAEAKGMLSLLSGRVHQVYTGICLIDTRSGRSISGADICQVTFSRLSNQIIDEYVADGEPMDKAGAYAIQGKGALLVDKIDGDYYTVMGLSLTLLRQLAGVLAMMG